MARLPPQPDLLVSLNRSIRTSATSINPVPSSPPTKAEKNSPIGFPPYSHEVRSLPCVTPSTHVQLTDKYIGLVLLTKESIKSFLRI